MFDCDYMVDMSDYYDSVVGALTDEEQMEINDYIEETGGTTFEAMRELGYFD